MKNADAIKKVISPRGAAGHIARYLSGGGRRLDERTVRYWGEGKHSPLDDMELLLHAAALVAPNSFQILAARLREMLAEIETDRGIAPANEQTSLARFHKESAEYLQSVLDGKPRVERLAELLDVIAVAQAEVTRLENEQTPSLRRVG